MAYPEYQLVGACIGKRIGSIKIFNIDVDCSFFLGGSSFGIRQSFEKYINLYTYKATILSECGRRLFIVTRENRLE